MVLRTPGLTTADGFAAPRFGGCRGDRASPLPKFSLKGAEAALRNGDHAPYGEAGADRHQPGCLRDVRRAEAPPNWPGRAGHFGGLGEMFAALRTGRPPSTGGSDNGHGQKQGWPRRHAPCAGARLSPFAVRPDCSGPLFWPNPRKECS